MNNRFRSRSDDAETSAHRLPAIGLVRPTKHPFPPPLDLLTVKETAALLKVCTKTVHRLIGDGKLKSCRVGQQIRINRHSIDVYLGLAPETGRREFR